MMQSSASLSRANPRMGYLFAAANALVSGFAVFINNYGVKTFKDSTLYTTLKNSVTGLILLVVFLALASQRERLRDITLRQWGLLGMLAILWGSLSYAIDFHGMQLSTPATSAFIGHAQFLLVALLALIFLGERFEGFVWAGLIALLVGLSLGMNYHTIHFGVGALWSASSTIVYALGFVLAKYLLRELSALTVMTAKMTIGAVLLISYVATTGSIKSVTHLNATQWSFVLGTGVILAAFTATAVLALRYASATAATAIPTAISPLITTGLVLFATQKGSFTPLAVAGLAVMFIAAIVVYVMGQRDEVHHQQKVVSA